MRNPFRYFNSSPPGTAELARLWLNDKIAPLEPELFSEELFVAF